MTRGVGSVAGWLAIVAIVGCASGTPPQEEPFALVETRLGPNVGESLPPFGGGNLPRLTNRIVVSTTPARSDLDEGSFDGDRITVPVPPDRGPLVIHLLNTADEVLASVRVEETPGDQQSVFVEPVSRETSVEAAVLAALADALGGEERVLLGTARAFTTPSLADALANALATRVEEPLELDAFVQAVQGAFVVEQEVASETGLALDIERVTDGERVASDVYAKAMYEADNADGETAARTALRASLDELRDEAGVDVAERLEVASAAGFFARAKMAATLETLGGAEAVTLEVARAFLLKETDALGAAVQEVLSVDDADASLAADAAGQVAALRLEIETATAFESIANAIVVFRTAFISEDQSIFERAIGVTDATQAGADAARQTARDEQRLLADRLVAQVEELRLVPTSTGLTVAENVAQEYVAMRIRLSQNAVGLALFGDRGETGLALLLAAERFGVAIP